MNKTQKVREELLAGHGITSMDAINKYGATRLASIVHNLRKSGMPIETVMHTMTDRYGNRCDYAEYRLKGVYGAIKK